MDLFERTGLGPAGVAGEAELCDPILGFQGRPAPMRYRVRLTTGDFGRVPVARVLIEALGCSPRQAVPATRRRGEGILAEGLTADAARRLRDGLERIGVSASLDAHLAG
jgi:hypothetical protein